MKQTSGFISTYSADAFGVCSALYELGGLVVMHDASGCNSTYTTHDEPRWYDMDSMVYISGLTEIEAIMGDDGRLIDDITNAATELHPKFIAIVGTTIPAMTGFDADATARVVENRTGIPTFGFKTTGMRSYIHGASEAFCTLAELVKKAKDAGQADNTNKQTDKPDETNKRINILGLTPLDFSVNGSDKAIKAYYEDRGAKVISSWAMGSTLEEIQGALRATENIVVSETGIKAAAYMKEHFGIPFKVGIPVGGMDIDITSLFDDTTGERHFESVRDYEDCDAVIVGETVSSYSLAEYLKRAAGLNVGVIASTDLDEDEIERGISATNLDCVIIADPLFKPLVKGERKLIRLPHEAFSGRIFRKEIPDLITDQDWLENMKGSIKK
ncbi:MAG: oxidoreductase [Lachnospiraceae bacterium]|nr:oxidoreductase [Lachnospiraceae bacterium]